MNTIFISYAREDKDEANKLRNALIRLGGDVWWDEDLPGGSKIRPAIEKRIRNASCVVVVWSKQAEASRWVPNEAVLASDLKRYVPVIIQSGFLLPIDFRHVHTNDLSSWDGSLEDKEFKKVLEGVEKLTGKLPGKSKLPEPPAVGASTDKEHPPQAPIAVSGVAAAGSGGTETADPLLSERVEALRQYLQPMTDMEEYVNELFANIPTTFTDDDESIWAALVTEISKQANRLIKTLDQIDSSLLTIGSAAEEEAAKTTRGLWLLYRETYKDSRQVFQESIELIGGLILRGSLKKTKVWEVADELIRFWARWALEGKGLLRIPAPKETFGKTVRRIIHLRFPEWTVWNLPHTAHEFGRVLVSESNDLKDLIQSTADTWLKDHPSTVPAGTYSADQAMEWQISRLQVLAADAFATYVMGPAYACNAIMVRLDPSISQDQAADPADFKRVYTVFNVLHRMDRASGRRSIYRNVIERLDEKWNRGLEKANTGAHIDDEEKKWLDDFIESVWQQLDESYLPKVRYSGEKSEKGGKNGWQYAEEWERLWDENIENGSRELSLPDVEATSKLRDALNAAWLCRLHRPEHIDLIAKAAGQLCEAILVKQRQAQERTRRQAGHRKDANRRVQEASADSYRDNERLNR